MVKSYWSIALTEAYYAVKSAGFPRTEREVSVWMPFGRSDTAVSVVISCRIRH